MWKVTCDYVRGVLTYFVEHSETKERKGEFDCQPWAEEFASELNKEEEERDRRKDHRRHEHN